MGILSTWVKITQQTDGKLGAQPTESGLEACDLNHKARGSQNVVPRPAAPSLPGNPIELRVP